VSDGFSRRGVFIRAPRCLLIYLFLGRDRGRGAVVAR